jgi:hypothetical protein
MSPEARRTSTALRRLHGKPAWQRRRRAWLRHRRATTHPSADPACVVCDRAWTLTNDLHHASYDRLGHERDADLVPMCRKCHDAMHRILDQSSHWHTMPRRTATARIITTLRNTQRLAASAMRSPDHAGLSTSTGSA